MEIIRHKTFGVGEVIGKEIKGNHTYITARFDSGKEMRFAIPESFEMGIVQACGLLQEEVEAAIAARETRLAAESAARALSAAAASATAKPARASSHKKLTPVSPVESDYINYLISEGYSVESDSGNPSTVFAYARAVEYILGEEGISWDTLKTDISDIVEKYDIGGAKQAIGAKSNNTYINALKRFEEYVA